MKVEFAARVDIGIKDTNDDRILVNGSVLDNSSLDGEFYSPSVVAVCDGCGGYLGGDIAAQIVAELLANEDSLHLLEMGYLTETLEKCQQKVADKKRAMPQFEKMCTTIAGCVIGEDCFVVFHAGDSRVYRCDSWGIARMTKDHSIVQDMIDAGEITPEEAIHHPKRNVITRCIGLDGRNPEIYVSHTPIGQGEKYLLCSDGLWECVNEVEVKEILNSDLSLKEMADVLVNRAKALGSDDNISVCICAREGSKKVVVEKPYVLD